MLNNLISYRETLRTATSIFRGGYQNVSGGGGMRTADQNVEELCERSIYGTMKTHPTQSFPLPSSIHLQPDLHPSGNKWGHASSSGGY